MSTAQQIEDAIRALEKTERAKLLQHLPHLPQLFPELAVDPEWETILHDDRPRPAFSALLDRYEADLFAEPDSFPEVAETDFD